MKIDHEKFKSLSEDDKKSLIDFYKYRDIKKEQQRAQWITSGWPKSFSMFFAGFLGLPVERYRRQIKHPIIILSFIFLMIIVFLLQMQMGMNESFLNYGFITAKFYRSYFITFFTSFFLHANVFHLLGNIYYFYIFGDDVEDDLGFKNFVKLLFFGHISGVILHSILSGQYHTPLLGASAGVSALMGYYMMRFPKRQITYMLFFFYVWLHLPALFSFLWKFGWEFIVATSNRGSYIAHWAHLGGFLYGVVFYVLKNPQKSKT